MQRLANSHEWMLRNLGNHKDVVIFRNAIRCTIGTKIPLQVCQQAKLACLLLLSCERHKVCFAYVCKDQQTMRAGTKRYVTLDSTMCDVGYTFQAYLLRLWKRAFDSVYLLEQEIYSTGSHVS